MLLFACISTTTHIELGAGKRPKINDEASLALVFPPNGIAMGAAGDEHHVMPRRRHSPAEISSDRPRCNSSTT